MFVNTQYFREAALDYKKNKGRYTLAPKGSKEWWDYWEEQDKRCREGYRVGDVKITGRHYGYLNFGRIMRTLGKGKTERKVEDFPGFWEIDYNWWWYKEIAWFGCDKEFLDKLRLWRRPKANKDGTYGGAKHLSCLKTRRAGFSYKEAWDGVYNYNWIPRSKSYFFASLEDYLTVDGILNKVIMNFDWLNDHTDGYYLKNRHVKSSLTDMEFRASYRDRSTQAEKGFKSEIIGVIVDDPNKVRGKDGIKATFEEAGKFKHLKAALDIILPSMRAGSSLTGQMSVFGTGGEEGVDIEGLDEIFNDPEVYDMLMFENDWEEGFEATECGVFIPCYMADPTFMDNDGNVDIQGAIEADQKERDKAKKAKDAKKLDRRMAEFPRTPTEALIRVAQNNFPVVEAIYQRNRIKKNASLRDSLIYCNLVRTEKGVQLEIKSKEDARPIDYYPHKQDDDLSGCVVIAEKPLKPEEAEKVDYFVVVDPYYDEEAEDKTSLGAVQVWKRQGTMERKVAWFTGRPVQLVTLYETIFKLADLYTISQDKKCKIQSEMQGGGKGLLDYAKAIKRLDMLEFEPFKINNQEIEKDKKNRRYFINLSTDDKIQGLTYYADWLRTPVGFDEDGNELWNIHFEMDLGNLEEIIKFSHKRNVDRISANIIAQYQLREKRGKPPGSTKKKRKRLKDRDGVFGKDGGTNNKLRIVYDENTGEAVLLE